MKISRLQFCSFLRVSRADSCHVETVAYAENLHGGGLIQWQMVVITISCTLFVTYNWTSY